MIRFSAIVSIVVVALGLLVTGAASGKLVLVYLSIGVAALALVLLIAGVLVWRAEIFGEPAASTTAAGDQPAEFTSAGEPVGVRAGGPGAAQVAAPAAAAPGDRAQAGRNPAAAYGGPERVDAGDRTAREFPPQGPGPRENLVRPERSKRDDRARQGRGNGDPDPRGERGARQGRSAREGQGARENLSAREKMSARDGLRPSQSPGASQDPGDDPGTERPDGPRPAWERFAAQPSGPAGQPASLTGGQEPSRNRRADNEVGPATRAEATARQEGALRRPGAPSAVPPGSGFAGRPDPAHSAASGHDTELGTAASAAASPALPPLRRPNSTAQDDAQPGHGLPPAPSQAAPAESAAAGGRAPAASGSSAAGRAVSGSLFDPAAARLASSAPTTNAPRPPASSPAAPTPVQAGDPAAQTPGFAPTTAGPAPTTAGPAVGTAPAASPIAGNGVPGAAPVAGAQVPGSPVTGSPAADGSDGGATGVGSPAATRPAAEVAVGGPQVTVVPGIARYHMPDCILIRFLGEDDLEAMPLGRAEESGCVPCRACRPERALAGA